MSVRSAKSGLMRFIETTLDDNEDYIGVVPFKALEKVFEETDDLAIVLEEENAELKEKLEEALAKIEELESEEL